MPHKVELTYFKQSGKYYSSGDYLSEKKDLWEIWDEVRQMVKDKQLPGLIGGQEFYILVSVPTHEHDHPRLIMPMEIERHG